MDFTTINMPNWFVNQQVCNRQYAIDFQNNQVKTIYASTIITLNPTFASDNHSPCNITASRVLLAVSFITFTIRSCTTPFHP
ncbi:hypothetical protein MTR_3g063330 [Medicago truncatula]|uniref:Uncharacterized protein n=1 Tax=Medicago truncatula TaxID=3880 RepID=A0A072UYP3_MEDTR|nr:hypothetical protein MTR_3g063330 [Medicago truncatula]